MPNNITVNCICPGAVETPMLRRAFADSPDPETAMQSERQLVPIKRFLDLKKSPLQRSILPPIKRAELPARLS